MKMRSWAVAKRQEPLRDKSWMLQEEGLCGSGEDCGWRGSQGGGQEEVGKGPQLLRGISYPLCTCLLLSTLEMSPQHI